MDEEKKLEEVRHWTGRGGDDPFLPNQAQNKCYFDGDNIEKAIYDFSKKYSSVSHEDSITTLENGVNVSSHPISLMFLDFLLSLIKPRWSLEVGTFTGLSAMRIAKHSQFVFTIEKFQDAAETAKSNFKKHGFKNITLQMGDAKEILPAICDTFDFIFFDGDKGNYDFYYQQALDLINPGGVILFDDIFFHGDLFNNELTMPSKSDGIRKMMNLSLSFPGSRLILPMGNGMLLLKKEK